MVKLEYIEGKQAKQNFEEGMKALFKVPKAQVVKAEKRKQQKRVVRVVGQRKQALDKD